MKKLISAFSLLILITGISVAIAQAVNTESASIDHLTATSETIEEPVIAVSTSTAAPSKAVLNMSTAVHNFGKITQNQPVNHTFTFTNSGSEPLILSNVKTSCGCTAANWTKEPIAPGAEGSIETSYNAKKAGSFAKTVTVTSNADEKPLRLTLKGEVIADTKE